MKTFGGRSTSWLMRTGIGVYGSFGQTTIRPICRRCCARSTTSDGMATGRHSARLGSCINGSHLPMRWDPRLRGGLGGQRAHPDSVVRDNAEMARPICASFKGVQDSLVVGIRVVTRQPKQYHAGPSRQVPSKGQGPEVLIMSDNQPVFLGRPPQDRVIGCGPHGLLDGHYIVAAPAQFADDSCTDVLIGDDTHFDRQAGSEYTFSSLTSSPAYARQAWISSKVR